MAYKVLFICIANISRSQMGQAIFNYRKRIRHYVDENYEAVSAGIDPIPLLGPMGPFISHNCLQVLEERGIFIDPKTHYPKKVTGQMLNDASIVICLDSGITSSDLYNHKPHDNWGIPDAFGLEGVRKNGDRIMERCEKLITSLDGINPEKYLENLKLSKTNS